MKTVYHTRLYTVNTEHDPAYHSPQGAALVSLRMNARVLRAGAIKIYSTGKLLCSDLTSHQLLQFRIANSPRCEASPRPGVTSPARVEASRGHHIIDTTGESFNDVSPEHFFLSGSVCKRDSPEPPVYETIQFLVLDIPLYPLILHMHSKQDRVSAPEFEWSRHDALGLKSSRAPNRSRSQLDHAWFVGGFASGILNMVTPCSRDHSNSGADTLPCSECKDA
jgi:hypothetical protein